MTQPAKRSTAQEGIEPRTADHGAKEAKEAVTTGSGVSIIPTQRTVFSDRFCLFAAKRDRSWEQKTVARRHDSSFRLFEEYLAYVTSVFPEMTFLMVMVRVGCGGGGG